MHFSTTVCYLAASAGIAASQGLPPELPTYIPFDYGPADSSMSEDCIWATHLPDPNIPWQGSTCASIAEYFRISEANFTEWNPVVGADCSNLAENSTYCVQTKGCHCGQLSGPVDPATTKDCTLYSTWPSPIGDPENKTCASFGELYPVDKEDLIAWNPSVGSDCSNLTANNSYCFEVSWEPFGRPDWWFFPGTSDPYAEYRNVSSGPRPGKAEGPIDPSTVEDCTFYINRPTGDTEDSCEEIAEFYQISVSDFFEWNPVLGGECGNLVGGNSYCVEVNGTDFGPMEADPTTLSTPSATSAPSGSTADASEEASETSTPSAAAGPVGGTMVFTFATAMILLVWRSR